MNAEMPELEFPNFKESGQDEDWKNQVAKQLNAISSRAEFIAGDPYPDEYDVEFVTAAHAIILRVAEFENIEKVPAE